MSKMIDRVAEAIRLRAIDRGHPIDTVTAHHLAAAAIESMREITPDIDDMHPPFVQKKDFHESWTAMHDMALAGPLRPAGSADLHKVPRAEE